MDNTYQKGQANGGTVPIKMPKNIRQMGNVLYHGRIIYVEDYVMTFLKQLADIDPGELRAAVFLGYTVQNEEARNIFIKGAVEMKNTDFSTGVTLTDNGWTGVYENIKKYFTDVEIVGWALIGPGFYLESNDKIRKVHTDNFAGNEKVLLKMDSMEREEAFYFCENNQLVKQPGYYIYYEKNEEMQSYMIENKEEKTVREEEIYNDQTTRKIRSIIQDKKEVKDDRSVIKLLYAASSLLAIIVLVIAATMMDNYDRMKKMETALSSLSQNLNMASNEGTTGDSAEGDSNVPVETVDGKVTPEPVKDTEKVGEAGKDSTETADNSAETDETINNTEDVESSGNTAEDTSDTKDSESTVKDDADTKSGESTVKDDSDTKSDANAEKDNTDTKSADDEKDTAPASATVKYYTVKPGDSLAGISFKLYKTYTYMDKIKKLNKIEDENKIMAGQKLIVP